MNKEKLEELFTEQVTGMRVYDEYNNEITDKIYDFIFETIIPEVLKSILEINWERSNDFTKSKISWNYILKDIKQKAKELYWITV